MVLPRPSINNEKPHSINIIIINDDDDDVVISACSLLYRTAFIFKVFLYRS